MDCMYESIRGYQKIDLDFRYKLFLVLLTTNNADEFNEAYRLLTNGYKTKKGGMFKLMNRYQSCRD